MKYLIIFFFLAAIVSLSGCTTDQSGRSTEEKQNEKQRPEEPQQRDGLPEPAITDSLSNDSID